MDENRRQWSKTVFRLRGLLNTVETLADVASLVSETLSDIPVDHIHVFSLATALNPGQALPSKVATIMFATTPSILRDSSLQENEWHIRAPKDSRTSSDFILDTHFMGMTPLNDPKTLHHSYDCIAISGLASHPFGSWQPKGSDKTFMWIRDDLPKHLQGLRTVIYGYDTKLHDSQSLQTISDLSDELINQLLAYGWASRPAKPVAFLAHSLGGLVVKEALLKLATNQNEAYKHLLTVVRGAIFFGVPNLGMEQAHFRAIVQSNPNEALIDDIARNSNYLRRLNDAFSASSLDKCLKCFWAYETSESPTVVRTADGQVSRDGPLAILVSRESATCRFVMTNPSITFPINATHSDMAKFSRDSHYCHVVISKLSQILRSTCEVEYGTDYNSRSGDQLNLISDEYDEVSAHVGPRGAPLLRTEEKDQEPLENNLRAEFDKFKRISSLTDVEENDLRRTTFAVVRDVISELHVQQERIEKLMYMKRLEPFVLSMQQFGEVAMVAKVFFDVSYTMAYVWGPMKYVLRVTSTYDEAFNSVLDAYQEIGEDIPRLQGFQSLSASNPHFRDVLVMIYKDVLWFHRETIRQLKQRQWMQLFSASWRDFAPSIEQIKQKIARNRRLIESPFSVAEFEANQIRQLDSMYSFERDKADQAVRRRATVMQWLSPFHCEAEQDKHRKTRSVGKDPGRWLLDDTRFKEWFSPNCCSTPLLWLSGIPGAGKTILASVIVDVVRDIPGATVAFFYCKYGEELRNSFLSVSRSILAQMLNQHPHLLSYFHEKASMNSDALLTSMKLAKEMMWESLRSCENTYIIIDGLDECGRDARKEITSWFRKVVEDLPATEMDSIRCLFVSQDDGIAVEDFRNVPIIKITNENLIDIDDFASVWHQRIEARFGVLKNSNIRNIISARAQGMFIFAELFAKYLEDQPNKTALQEELDPAKLPVNLDNVYERILRRVFESRGDHIVNYIRHILGWIVCARRPLRWREIQGAVCIDMENQHLDNDREMSDSPKGLFASLIELQADGTVDLVHGTARKYLISKDFVNPREAHYSLAMLSLSYLAFPQLDLQRNDDDIRSDLLNGIHPFYDYASSCWAIHLQDGISNLETGDELAQLQETLETFIELSWLPTHKPLQDLKRVHKSLSLMKSSKLYDRIAQAVGWAKKQSGQHGLGPSPDEALNLSQVTEKIRSVLENMHTLSLPRADVKKLQDFYGTNWFKCPRVNCYYYYQGFGSADQRNRHTDKHNRPFLCFVTGCPTEVFGCATQDELKKHLFTYHGIDEFEDTDNGEFPDPPKEKTSKSVKSDAIRQCPECDKKFTRNHNLKNHLRTHKGERPFECDVCGERFTRKADCDRHQRGHGDKKFICVGLLKDGGTWGCKASFGRADKLADHFRSKKGQKCLRLLLEEKLKAARGGEMVSDGNMFADQAGENADILLNAGKSLPSFQEFLQLSGLDVSAVGIPSEATSLSKAQDGKRI
ncbi:hypothetical protein AJ80_08953 [Polytolypa hystricis UAMH7299]|uniref:C2H2-type domain-containing protein n=1 Tax=Polytolypa hystricis (strain UAMH7299) TaxID=1447883 RepID=A0A2B7WZB8_POLH7|nr:hypothetical protein AJ80_08953 [Polytolypa hystricis UAMH7299]